MEKKILSEDQIKKLKEPLPEGAVSKHPTKTYLSSIKAIYVIERLNDVFGIGSWRLVSEIVDNKTSMIVVKAKLIIPEYQIELESYGGNDNGGENSKNFDLGDAYKGATTDALTKMCSFLGIAMSVFKGQGNAPLNPAGKKETPPVKKELTPQHAKWEEAKKKISEGTGSVEELEKVFFLTEENKSLLLAK